MEVQLIAEYCQSQYKALALGKEIQLIAAIVSVSIEYTKAMGKEIQVIASYCQE